MELEGVASDLRTTHEGGTVVLRFVVQSDVGRKIPVEMRGRRFSGLVGDGDRVVLSGRRLIGRDGVARPARVRNATTESDLRARQVRIRRLFATVTKVGISVASGLASTLAVSSFSSAMSDEPVAATIPPSLSFGGGDSSASATSLETLLPIALGLTVALVVLLVLFRGGRSR